jgi:hypothetical protein
MSQSTRTIDSDAALLPFPPSQAGRALRMVQIIPTMQTAVARFGVARR